MNEILVSVIMPVYNSKPYISECLNSLLSQSMDCFEIICVDDGSTDGTGNLLREYEKLYPFIKVVRQENKGAGSARNYGYSFAQGKYVIFLDSDDYFDRQLLEKVCDKAEKNNCDIVLFDIYRFDNQTKEIFTPSLNVNQKVLPSLEVFSVDDIPESIFNLSLGVTWNKLYKNRFIHENNLRFQEIRNSNSVYFSFATFLLAKRISVVNERLLYYRSNNPKSTVGQIGNSPLCFIDAWRALHDVVVSKNDARIQLSFAKAFITYAKRRLSEYKSIDTATEVYCYLKKTTIDEFELDKISKTDISSDLFDWITDLQAESKSNFFDKYVVAK